MSADVNATLLVDGLTDGLPEPGVYAARAGDPAYGWLDALVLSGDAKLLGERYDPDGSKYIAVSIGAAGSALTPNAVGAIRIGREFFTTALRDYQDWEEKWWREGVQNAVDAGATEIECRVEETPEGMAVSIADNGRGMDADTLLNKFLVLGGTTKGSTSGTRGGFGKAKELLVLPWLAWSIHTRDQRVTGSGVEYQVESAPYRQGTDLRVVMPKDQTTHASAAQAFIEKCYLPGIHFTVNGEARRAAFRVGKELRDFEGKARLYYDKKSPKNGLFVRTMGLCMFEMYVSRDVPGALIVELTGSSVDLLTANRDGFRDYELKRAVEQYVNELAADVSSALKDKRKLIRKKFEGSGKFVGAPPRELRAEVLNHLEEIIPLGETKRGKVLSDVQASTIAEIVNRLGGGEGSVLVPDESVGFSLNMRANGALAAAMLDDTVLPGATAIEAAVAQLAWEPDFFIANEVEGYHVPKMFFPEGMVPGVKKLARTWAELCRFVLIQLGCSLPFGVGFLFSQSTLAAYEPDENRDRWLLLNPFRNPADAGREKPTKERLYSLTSEDDVNQLYATAIHECTHMADGLTYHNESFSSAFTRNVGKTANKDRQVKAIVKAIKARGPRSEEAPKPKRKAAKPAAPEQTFLPELADRDLAAHRQKRARERAESDRKAYVGFYSDDHHVDTSGTLDEMTATAQTFTTYEVRDAQGRPVFRTPHYRLPLQVPTRTRSSSASPLEPLADSWLENQRMLRAQRPTSEYTSFRNDSAAVWDSDSDLAALQERAAADAVSDPEDYFEIRRPADGSVVWRSANFFGSSVSASLTPNVSASDPDFRAFIEQKRAERAAFVAMVEREVAASGAFVRPMRHVADSYVSLTRSTREGIDWQITMWDGDPRGATGVPTGHRDVVGPLATAAGELTALVDTRVEQVPNGSSLRPLNAWLRRNLPGRVRVLSTQGDTVEIGPIDPGLASAYLRGLEAAFPGAQGRVTPEGRVYVDLPPKYRSNRSPAALAAERGAASIVRSDTRHRVADLRGQIEQVTARERAEMQRLGRFAKAARARSVIEPTSSPMGDRCQVASAEQQARERAQVDAFYDSRRRAVQEKYAAEREPLEAAIARTKDLGALLTGGARQATKKLGRIRQTVAREESDSEVEAELDPSLLVVWRAVKRNFRATPKMSRAEAFLHWVEENPDEVTAFLAERTMPSDADLARAQLSEEARAAVRDDLDETEPDEIVEGDLPDVPFN